MDREALLKRVEKPGRYIGGEFGETLKDKSKMDARWAFCFPDTYEIGMSNLGIRILAGALNNMENVWCERCFAPWCDMEEAMRAENIPLWALESGNPLTDFDIVAFTLQYELCFSNVLNMLDLAHIPLRASERGEEYPIIIGGGPATYNSEPVADFFDVFSIGEGEEALPEFTELYIKMRKDGSYTKEKFLRAAAKLDGFYVPSLYDVSYNEDGTIKAFCPKYDDVPAVVTKRIVKDLDSAYFPDKLVMPYIETVHDRIVLEINRGCIRGCRFCQAGMVYRPVREKSPETLNETAKKLYKNTGYEEISLSSLSVSDYSRLPELCDKLLSWTDDEKVSLSLPSQRIDAFTEELMKRVSSVRGSGVTFAPEAGTQRLRDVINKNVTEEDLLRSCRVVFGFGKNTVKLYFMNGLPTETKEDIAGIADLAKKVIEEYYATPERVKGRAPTVTVSVSCFIPKPFTPFQWEAQNSLEELRDKQMYLASLITDKKIRYNWHEAKVSRIEAAFARGNRRLSRVLEEAHRLGVKFDAWDDFFSYEKWLAAFEAAGEDISFFANREMGKDEILPWDNININVSKAFLARERENAYKAKTTDNCRDKCSGCGANKFGGNCTWCPIK